MNKPKNYYLEKRRSNWVYLNLACYEADGCDYLKRCCFLNVGHGYELTAKTAETMGKRLLEMAKWLKENNNA